MKEISFDFELQSFVGIEAPADTDPETLREAAIKEFIRRLQTGGCDVVLFQTFDPETGDYEEKG